MYYDYKAEYRKFLIEFAKQKKLMLEAGMSEKNIDAVFEFDKAVFNRDRSYIIRKAEFVFSDNDEALAEKKRKPGISVSFRGSSWNAFRLRTGWTVLYMKHIQL